MQILNLNHQKRSYRKRKCIVYRPNDFFDSFDRSQHELIINYEEQAQLHMNKSLAIIIDNIRKSAKTFYSQHSNPVKSENNTTKDIFMSIAKNVPIFKKNLPQTIFEEDQYTNPEKQVQEMIIFEKTGKKIDKSLQKLNICKQERQDEPNPIQQKKHLKLMESLKKLSISNEQEELEKEIQNIFDHSNRALTEDTNLLQIDDTISNKPLSELILYSNKNQKKIATSPIESQDSQYQVTDYSSNQSSNDEGDYEERFAFDTDQKSLFGAIFAQGGKNFKPQQAITFKNGSTETISQPQKLNFKPLLDSPKKSKSKKKRLYINKKKVPKWADDLNKIAKLYGSQYQRNLRKDFNHIFGICFVQNMQTNPIFNRNDTYVRSSTVKWNHGTTFD